VDGLPFGLVDALQLEVDLLVDVLRLDAMHHRQQFSGQTELGLFHT
jgi:hypothetical protein